MAEIELARAIFALLVGGIATLWWPWDWRGRAKNITLKRERRPWE